MSDLNVAPRTQSVNGTAKRPARKQQSNRSQTGGRSIGRARYWITVGMGCGIPSLSLALSIIGGRLCREGFTGLGVGALGLCCSVLSVSLSHLAWAVRDITRSATWQSWALALAIDSSLVLGELAGVAGFQLWVVPAVMVCVTVVSAVLNCWAFLRHGR